MGHFGVGAEASAWLLITSAPVTMGEMVGHVQEPWQLVWEPSMLGQGYLGPLAVQSHWQCGDSPAPLAHSLRKPEP